MRNVVRWWQQAQGCRLLMGQGLRTPLRVRWRTWDQTSARAKKGTLSAEAQAFPVLTLRSFESSHWMRDRPKAAADERRLFGVQPHK
jgi:hypothetical protein